MDVRIHVAMIVRNEMDRHLERAAKCALEVAEVGGGEFIVTDDCSDDGSFEYLRDLARVQQHDEPRFMVHEGQARQSHLAWTSQFVESGDWVLSLDADETVNNPEIVKEAVREARAKAKSVVLMSLYEFWSESPLQYRVDGFWFGTQASRLYMWQSGGSIRDREFGCGSEPTYVAEAVKRGDYLRRPDLHLMHWGYVDERDRVLKHKRYSERAGGHGHNDKHVQSIVTTPELRLYE